MRPLVPFADLEQLLPRIVEVAGADGSAQSHLGLVRIDDEVYGFTPTCTHRAAPLIEGAVTWKRTILCPWHLGTYDLRSGRRMAGPPERGLSTFPLKVVDGVVWLDADAAEPGPAPSYPAHPYQPTGE